MKELKYIRLFDSEGILTHINDAEKGGIYYQYVGDEVEYIVRQGDVNRKHFSAKNPFNELSMVSFSGGGESIDHYNAKMEIVFNKKYFDTIIGKEITFHKVLAERKINNKIPDISCYDADNNLVMVIEIYNTNKKNDLDIQALKTLNVPVVEIDINDGNKCEHLILPTLLEANKPRYKEIRGLLSWIGTETSRQKNRIRDLRELANEQIRESGERYRRGYSDIEREHSKLEKEFKKERSTRLEGIDSYLQQRLRRVKVDNYRIGNVEELREEYRKLKIKSRTIENEIFKCEYRNDKLRTKVEGIESEIEFRKNNTRTFISQPSVRCEWYGNKHSAYKPEKGIEKINQIRYLCS